ncbi:Penicillin-binding protein 4* [Diplonema papillatum]|nr:Penicillin-binding protein 4* [Diplonema papillatum]
MLAVILLAAASAEAATPWPQLQEEIFALLNSSTHRYSEAMGSYALQSAFVGSQGTVVASAGYNNLYPTVLQPLPSQAGDGFLVGSATKMTTSAAIMRLVEAGTLRLDDELAGIVDGYIYERNKTTLSQLWHGDARIDAVTVRQLLSMTSGIVDFDSYDLRVYQELVAPQYDITPYDIIHVVNKTFEFSPGAGAAYSSTNYVLLGFVLAAKANATDWDTYDQAAVLPRRPGSLYANSTFAVHGTLSSYNTPGWAISHGYPARLNKSDLLWNVSATSGWTCGNFLTSASDMAQFTYDFLGPEHLVVSPATQRELVSDMRQLHNLDSLYYGLGVMAFSSPNSTSGWLIGHGGDTYGFISVSAFNMNYSYALTVTTNVESQVDPYTLFFTLVGNLSVLLTPH